MTFLMLQACSKKVKHASDNLEKLTIDINQAEKIKYHELIDTGSIKYIALQTLPESLLGRIERLKVFDDRFICVSNKKVLVFGNNGGFLYSINKKGKGTGEYLSIADVHMDNVGNIYILDRRGRKIVKYNEGGLHLSTLNTGLIGESFAKITKDVWAIYIGSNKNEVSSYRMNLYSEKQRKIIRQILPITKSEYRWMYFEDVNNFTLLPGNNILFNYSCNDTLYSLQNLTLVPFKCFDWGKNSLPASMLNDNYDDIIDFNKKTKGEYVISRIGMFSNDTHFCFGFRLNKKLYLALLNRATDEISIATDILNAYGATNLNSPVDLSLLPMASDPEFFYSILDPYLITDVLKETKTTPSIFNKVKIDDNPIIVKYKYKK